MRLNVAYLVNDKDGSETLSVSVSAIPVGATLTDGVNSFTATAGQTSVDISGWSIITKQLGSNFGLAAGTKSYTIPTSQTIPAGGSTSLRLRLKVVGAPVGVGLLNADRSAFAESRRILPGIEPALAFLPVADTSAVTQLVVHTWDLPERARVRIDDITYVW